MRTITVEGDPESLMVIMVPKSDNYKDHETVRIESSDEGHPYVLKNIFRVVDAGNDQWELQFE
jgi:hypothetical protein